MSISDMASVGDNLIEGSQAVVVSMNILRAMERQTRGSHRESRGKRIP